MLHWKHRMELLHKTEENASTDKDSAVYNNLRTCTNYNHLESLFRFENNSFNGIEFDTIEVQNNTELIDSAHN